MLPGKSQTPYDRVELVYAIIAIIFLIAVVFNAGGCVSVTSEPAKESKWNPHTYKHYLDGTRCTFVDSGTHVIDCDEPVIDEYVLIHLGELKRLKAIFKGEATK